MNTKKLRELAEESEYVEILDSDNRKNIKPLFENLKNYYLQTKTRLLI